MGLLSRFTNAIGKGTWLTVYRRSVSSGESPEQAIFQVLQVVQRRAPFDGLSHEQCQQAAKLLSQLPDPEFFADILLQIEHEQNADILADIEQLQQVVEVVKSQSA
jgi:flagellar motor switch protein FliG